MEEILLTIDTATPAGSVAVSRGEKLLGETFWEVTANHTDRLLGKVLQLLADVSLTFADVAAYGVVCGPGSFTGLRVGIATVKGLALANGRPAIGVSSLATLAMAVPFPRFPVCALIDARKQEVYAGLFTWQGGLPQVLRPEAVLPPQGLLETLTGETIFVGNGSEVYRTLIVRHLGSLAHFAPWPVQSPKASLASALVLDLFRRGEAAGPEMLLPRYLRLSEAELNLAKQLAQTAIEG